MPLEIEFRQTDGNRLKAVTELQQAIAAELPGMRFFRRPSGAEEIRMASERGVEFPPFLRENLEKIGETYQGEYNGDGFSLQFYFGSCDLVDSFYVNVRGTGDATKTLSRIAACTGWKAVILMTGAELTDADWSGFQSWRDKSIEQIKANKGAAPNGGPTASLDNSNTDGGPPSVS